MFILKNCRHNFNEVCASKPWPFSSVCKNLKGHHPVGAIIWFSKKVDLGGSKLTCPTLLLVDQSLPNFFAQRERSHCRRRHSDFGYLLPFRRYSPSKFEVVRSRPKFCTFSSPNVFGGKGPRIFRPEL